MSSVYLAIVALLTAASIVGIWTRHPQGASRSTTNDQRPTTLTALAALAIALILLIGLRNPFDPEFCDSARYATRYLSIEALGPASPRYDVPSQSTELLWNAILRLFALGRLGVAAWFTLIAAIWVGSNLFAAVRLFPSHGLLAFNFALLNFGFLGLSTNAIRNGASLGLVLVALALLVTSAHGSRCMEHGANRYRPHSLGEAGVSVTPLGALRSLGGAMRRVGIAPHPIFRRVGDPTVIPPTNDRRPSTITPISSFLILSAAVLIHHSVALPTVCLLLAVYVIKRPVAALALWIAALLVALTAGPLIPHLITSLDILDHTRLSYYAALAQETIAKEKPQSLNLIPNASLLIPHSFRWDFVLFSLAPMAWGAWIIFRRKAADRAYNIIFTTYVLANAAWLPLMYTAQTNRIAMLSWFLQWLVICYPLLRATQKRETSGLESRSDGKPVTPCVYTPGTDQRLPITLALLGMLAITIIL